MNRYILYTIALLMMGCSKEESPTTELDQMVDVSFCAYASKIFVDGSQSRSLSGAELDSEKYDVRYIIEAWGVEQEPTLYYRGVETFDEVTSGLYHTMHIIEGQYNFLFWADYVLEDTTADYHYDTNSLLGVTIKSATYDANDLSRDCFVARVESVTVDGSFDLGSVELSRPMAMLVIKDDDATAVTTGQAVSITFTEDLPNGYNVLSGDVIYGEGIAPQYEATTANEDIAFDYIFLSNETTTTYYDISITVGETTKSSETTPFEKNKKTNIIATFFENNAN